MKRFHSRDVSISISSNVANIYISTTHELMVIACGFRIYSLGEIASSKVEIASLGLGRRLPQDCYSVSRNRRATANCNLTRTVAFQNLLSKLRKAIYYTMFYIIVHTGYFSYSRDAIVWYSIMRSRTTKLSVPS